MYQLSHFCTAPGRMSPYFTMGYPSFLSKLTICIGYLDPPSNTCSLGPTQVHVQNGILIGSAAFFSWLMIVADRQTTPLHL